MSEHPRKPGRYRVRFADGRAFVVDADSLTALSSMREGTELGEDVVRTLEASHQFMACFDRGLGMLARARRTEREMMQRLRLREPDQEIVRRAVDRLQSLGLLDDAEVARAEAASRFRRGEGTGRIRQSLMRKGIERSVIDAAVREVTEAEEVDEDALCREAGAKRLGALRALAPEVQRRRLLAFLVRRGFSGYVARDVVHALVLRSAHWESDDSEELLAD